MKYNAVESYLKDFEAKRTDLEDSANLLRIIRFLHLEEERGGEGIEVVNSWYGSLIDKLSDFQPAPIRFCFNPHKSSWQLVRDLLDQSQKRQAETFVGLHLVGATLQFRFPLIDLNLQSFSTSSVHLDLHGDFCVGDTIFHVMVPPTLEVYEKCKRNLRDGFRVYLLVRNEDVVGTKQNAENTAAGQIAVESIETFVSQNLDELSVFSREQRISEFRHLLEIYNRRVDEVEANKSLMIEIPPNLFTD